jgi:hypothetical protein
MYHCAGLQPVPFAARDKQPKLAGNRGLEPPICWLTASDPRPVRSLPRNLDETIFIQHTHLAVHVGSTCLVADVRIELTIVSL